MSKKTKVLALMALASTFAFAGPVSHFGKLVSCGSNICGEKTGSSLPIQLKGPSLYWSTGSPSAMFSPIAVDWFVNNFEIGVIRLPMAIKYYRENSEPISATDGNPDPVTSFGYLSKDGTVAGQNKAMQKALIKEIVNQAILDDIYVIVDWHSHNAQNETNEAANFFKELATEYKDVPNLIWEIYNEPVSASAGQIHSYAQTVTAAIRGAGNDNLVIVGSTFYSSNPNQQASQGLHNTYKNIAYTLHFYAAANHNSYMNNKASGAPTFVTEWGATDANGDGNVSDASSWRSWMDQNKVSGCMWFAGNDKQSSAMFPSDATPQTLDNYKSRFSGTNSTAGVFNAFMSTNKWSSFVPSDHPFGKSFAYSLAEGKSVTFSSELGLKGTITSATSAYGQVSHTDNSITFQSPEYGSPASIDIIYKVKSGSIEIQEKILVKMTDRKPSLKDTTISASHKNVSKYTLLKLGASDPATGSTNALTLKDATASSGRATVSADTIIYEPAGEGLVTITYSVSNNKGTSVGTLTLNCENQPPTIYAKTTVTSANTDQVMLSLHRVRGKDADGDSIWFKAWTKGSFPGTLQLNGTGDTLIYTPEANRTGTVTVLAVLTDGKLDSRTGTIQIKLTGSGASFDGTIPVPTQIDGYVAPEGSDAIVELKQPVLSGLMVKNRQVLFSIPQSKFVTLDVFDMKGHKVQTLVQETMSAGTHAVNVGSMPKGMYILRLRYGSQMKSLRFVNR
jgi:hypothetical protein